MTIGKCWFTFLEMQFQKPCNCSIDVTKYDDTYKAVQNTGKRIKKKLLSGILDDNTTRKVQAQNLTSSFKMYV